MVTFKSWWRCVLTLGLIFVGGMGIGQAPADQTQSRNIISPQHQHFYQQKTSPASSPSEIPPYLPGRLIVKYKLTKPAEDLFANKMSFDTAIKNQSINQSANAKANYLSLDDLNRKYKVTSVKPLLRKTAHSSGRSKLTPVSMAEIDRDEEAQLKNLQKRLEDKGRKITPGNFEINTSQICVVQINRRANPIKAAQEFAQNPGVEYATADYLFKTNVVFNDPKLVDHSLWGLDKIQAPQAWDESDGEGVVVAVVDTGVDWDHPDIAPNVWHNPNEIPGNGLDDDGNGYVDDVDGYNFTDDHGSNVMDHFGHGTHVAGTIAAVGNNGIGVAGVAPRAHIMILKALGNDGSGALSWLAEAINYAARNGAGVINNSWGTGGRFPYNPLMADVIQRAHHQLGAVVVASAGNSLDDATFTIPANIPEVLTVAASDTADQRSWFSNFGSVIDVAAPGEDVLSLNARGGNNFLARLFPSLVVDRDYLRLNGTSMAAPHVSGLAALIISHQRHFPERYPPDFSNETVANIVRSSADDLGADGFDADSGYGRINAERALWFRNAIEAKIQTPTHFQFFPDKPGSVTINGEACGSGFEKYQLFYSKSVIPGEWIPIGPEQMNPVGDEPPQWRTIRAAAFDPETSHKNNVQGVLGTWNTEGLSPDTYWIKLKVTGHNEQGPWTSEDTTQVTFGSPLIRKLSGDLRTLRWFPKVSGDNVVWLELGENAIDILYRDFNASTMSAASIKTDSLAWGLNISGDNLVYFDNHDGNDDIFLNHLGTRLEEQLIDSPSFDWMPTISGKHVGWVELNDSTRTWKLRHLDLESGLQEEIASAPYDPNRGGYLVNLASDISERGMVFTNYLARSSYDIDVYDFKTQRIRRITDGYQYRMHPLISGNKVVFTEFLSFAVSTDDENYDFNRIYLYDLDRPELGTRKIWEAPGFIYGMDFDGSWLVWSDDRNGNLDLFGFDLSRHQEIQFTSDLAHQFSPHIDGKHVVFLDERPGSDDTYALNLDEIPIPVPMLEPPVVTPVRNKSVVAGHPIVFWPIASGPGLDQDSSFILKLPNGEIVGPDAENSLGINFWSGWNTAIERCVSWFRWTPREDQVGEYTLTFEAKDRNGLTGSHTMTITVTEPPRPDARVTGFELNNLATQASSGRKNILEGDDLRFSVVYTNAGEIAMPSHHAALYVDGQKVDEQAGGPLLVNAVRTIEFAPQKLIAGTHEVTMAIDSQEEVRESDEKNNEINRDVKVLPQSADMAVTQFFPEYPAQGAISDTRFRARLGDDLYFTATFRNIGKGIMKASKMSYLVNGKAVARFDVPEMRPNEMQTYVSYPSWKARTLGTHIVSVVMDCDQDVDETNEKNNTKTFVVEVLSQLQPDLSVRNFFISAPGYEGREQLFQVFEGQDISFHALVQNLGRGGANASLINFMVDDAVVAQKTLPALASGQQRLSNSGKTWNARRGRYVLKAVVDPDEAIEETSEGNNLFMLTIEVKPKASGEMISPRPNLPTLLRSSTITFEWMDLGDVDEFWLSVGRSWQSVQGNREGDIFNQPTGKNPSATLRNLPVDDQFRQIFLRVWMRQGKNWTSKDFVYWTHR